MSINWKPYPKPTPLPSLLVRHCASMHGFDDLYYPSSSPGSSAFLKSYMNQSSFIGDGFDASHNFNLYNHSAWKKHYPQTRPSQVRPFAAERSYCQEPSSVMIQQPSSDLARLPQMTAEDTICMADMEYSPYSIPGGDVEMESSINWELSPHNNASPSLSSDSTSSPSPSLPSPSVAAQPPLIIHQPRPYRRIPIISLSQLASACDDIVTKPSPKQTALSPLPFEYLDFNIEPLSAGVRQPQIYPYLSPCNAYKSPTMVPKNSDRTILCPCGCMGHYICG